MVDSANSAIYSEFISTALKDKTVVKWSFIDDSFISKEFQFLIKSLPLTVTKVSFKGQIIYIILSNSIQSFYVFHHLTINGKWDYTKNSKSIFYIQVQNGSKLWYNNVRKSISLQVTTEPYIFKNVLNKIGVDIISSEFTMKKWEGLLEKHLEKNITSFLTNQSIISGCGSCIKSESLYYSCISPFRKIKSLKERERSKLYEALRIISRMIYNNRWICKVYKIKRATKIKTVDGRITYYDDSIQL